MQETLVQFLDQEDPREKGKATHSSILAWRIPWTVHGVTKRQTQLNNFHFTFSLAGWLPSVDSSVRMCVPSKLLQSCPTLCNPMDCGPPGNSVRGILQEKLLEWVAISYSRGSSQPRDQIHVSYVSCIGRQVLYYYCHLGSPFSSTCPLLLAL